MEEKERLKQQWEEMQKQIEEAEKLGLELPEIQPGSCTVGYGPNVLMRDV